MSEPTREARPATAAAVPAWQQAGRDLISGMLVTGQFVVTLAGCIALVGGAALLGNQESRERALALLPTAEEFWGGNAAEAQTIAQEPAAVETAPEKDPAQDAQAVAALNAAQKNVARFLSKRYRVAEEAVQRLVATAYETGAEIGLDPLLILAVAAIESSMNPFAESSVGAQGLMQVMTRVHADRFEPHGGGQAALDPITNIRVGAQILHELVRRGGSVERGLQLYVGAGNMPHDGGYGARVLNERKHIALAASGKVDVALATAWRQSVESKAAAAVAPRASTPASTEVDASPSETKTLTADSST